MLAALCVEPPAKKKRGEKADDQDENPEEEMSEEKKKTKVKAKAKAKAKAAPKKRGKAAAKAKATAKAKAKLAKKKQADAKKKPSRPTSPEYKQLLSWKSSAYHAAKKRLWLKDWMCRLQMPQLELLLDCTHAFMLYVANKLA